VGNALFTKAFELLAEPAHLSPPIGLLLLARDRFTALDYARVPTQWVNTLC